MKIYLIAGEASGDLHASNLIKALKEQRSDIDFRGWGGHLMEEAGMTLVKHYRDTAVMGLINVLLKLRSIKRNINACKSDIRSWNPDLVIFIDYPGFNLRIAEFTKALSIPNYYYIAPKVWASRESRIEKIKAYIDRLFVILPFEKEYFSKNHPNVEYVGNPIMDALSQYDGEKGNDKSFCKELNMPDKPIIALLAGSRDHEVNQVLPFFLHIADIFG